MNNVNSSLKKVSFYTLGCRLNSAETSILAQGFVDRGYSVVDFEQKDADVVFLNTCTVTDKADSTCRNLIRKAHKNSPSAKIIVSGCYAQMEPERIAKIKGVDLVLGSSEKFKVFNYLNEEQKQIVRTDLTYDFYSAHTTNYSSKTRAFLKIQDGCNYICSFCIIPQARGRSRAISIEAAVMQANNLVDRGFKEIVLTGVNIGEYQSSSNEKLEDLVAKILKIEKLKRLRLSSVEPNTITDELLDVFKSSKKFMNHFHIPLQSGDDNILQKMRRKYSKDQYRRLIEKIVKSFPNCGIGADIIAGFPSESEAQFENTYSFLKDLPITHFHVFPYSKRKNTMASRMSNHLQYKVKKDRALKLIELGDKKLTGFTKKQGGKYSEVLFENLNNDNKWQGYTTNYLKVVKNSKDSLANKILNVKLSSTLSGLQAID